MGPIRSLELAQSTDTAGLAQNTLCQRELLCVGGLFAGRGGDEEKRSRKSIISILMCSIKEGWLKYEL